MRGCTLFNEQLLLFALLFAHAQLLLVLLHLLLGALPRPLRLARLAVHLLALLLRLFDGGSARVAASQVNRLALW